MVTCFKNYLIHEKQWKVFDNEITWSYLLFENRHCSSSRSESNIGKGSNQENYRVCVCVCVRERERERENKHVELHQSWQI